MLQQIPSSTCLSNLDSQSGNIFLFLLNTLLASQCALKNPDLYPPDNGPKIKDGDHFDFIVVGAGSTGSVVGSRLVESGKWTVLVVEAGDFPSITTEIPALFFSIQQSDQIWSYHTEPASTSCLGYENSVCHSPRGKLLGGCSSINAMIYQRGSKHDHDSWYREGNEGWEYESLIEYYKKSEKLLAKNLQDTNSYGKEGLLPITKYKFNETIRDVIFESAKQLGYEILEEGGPLGFFESRQTIDGGVRRNSAKVFLGSVKDETKLTLAVNAQVEKVIIDKVAKAAEGIKVKIGGKLINVYADKEVILSAGALNSPQLLMLSGVGPKKHLQDVGLEVIHDLKVGENLKDHVVMWAFSKLDDEALKPTNMLDEIYKYFTHREGMLSNIGLANVQAFLNTKNDSIRPDLLFFYAIFPKNDSPPLDSFLEGIHLNKQSSEKLKKYNAENHILITFLILSQPKAIGKVILRSKDASSSPVIRSGYFTDEKDEDLETFLRGIRLLESQLKTEAFKKLNAEILNIGIPNCEHLEFDTDDYWRCAVRNLGTTMYHVSSTCKMGPKSDADAVVDPRLRVHGIKNLRVADASIMPNVVSGPPHAACTMIGQKGAQMIIEDHLTEHLEL